MSKKLTEISIDELERRLNAVRATIRRTRENGGDSRMAEIDLCYLEREFEHRQLAFDLDERFRQGAREEKFQVDRREEEEAIRNWLEYSRDNEKFLNC